MTSHQQRQRQQQGRCWRRRLVHGEAALHLLQIAGRPGQHGCGTYPPAASASYCGRCGPCQSCRQLQPLQNRAAGAGAGTGRHWPAWQLRLIRHRCAAQLAAPPQDGAPSEVATPGSSESQIQRQMHPGLLPQPVLQVQIQPLPQPLHQHQFQPQPRAPPALGCMPAGQRQIAKQRLGHAEQPLPQQAAPPVQRARMLAQMPARKKRQHHPPASRPDHQYQY